MPHPLLILILAVLACLAYLLLLQQVIRPLRLMQFYRRQGIQCEFVPFAGSSPQDASNVTSKGDYYHDWLQKALAGQKSKLFCKNVGGVVSLVLTDP